MRTGKFRWRLYYFDYHKIDFIHSSNAYIEMVRIIAFSIHSQHNIQFKSILTEFILPHNNRSNDDDGDDDGGGGGNNEKKSRRSENLLLRLLLLRYNSDC